MEIEERRMETTKFIVYTSITDSRKEYAIVYANHAEMDPATHILSFWNGDTKFALVASFRNWLMFGPFEEGIKWSTDYEPSGYKDEKDIHPLWK